MIPRIVLASFLALIVLVPIPFGANRMWAWGLLAVLGGLAVLAMSVTAVVNAANLSLSWRHYRWLAAGYLVVLAWMVVQAIPGVPAFLQHPVWAEASAALGEPLRGAISMDPAASLGEATKFAAYGCVFWVALQFAGRDHRARYIMWAVLGSAFLNSVYGLLAHFSGSDMILWYEKWSYQHVVTGTFVNRNHFATFTGIALIVAFGFLMEELRRISSGISLRSLAGILNLSENLSARLIILAIVISILTLALILTGSRGALAASGVGLAAFMAATALSQRISGARVARLAAVLAVAGIIAVVFNGHTAIERLSQAGANFDERLTVYKATAAAIMERPILGTGGGTFENIFLAHRPEKLWVTLSRYDYAHNTYLEFALEHGLIALMIMLVVAGLIVARFIKGASTRRYNDVFPAIGIGATALVAVHSTIDFSLEIPAVAVIYLAVAATAYSQSLSHRSRGISTETANDNNLVETTS